MTLIFIYRKEECFSHKVFELFDFGHFFCPFLKSQNTFHYRKRVKMSLNTILNIYYKKILKEGCFTCL